MLVRYSSLNRLEKPQFVLCSPGSVYDDDSGLLTNMVGILSGTSDEEIIFNFNSTSELNLRVSKIKRETPEENAHVFATYKAIQNRRLIFVEDIGFFMITGVVDGFDGKTQYKDVSAKSIDNEIAQKMVPYIENGTYRFTSDITEGRNGILEKIVETLPLWTIGHVDESVASKYRTFEDVDTSANCLSFLLEDIQDAYECIIVFDIIHRTIDVFAQDNYVRETDIHITKEDLISSLDITENADDLYTAITVLGNDNVTISAINPLGTNTIYNFDYYLSWMSSNLGDKVKAWQNAVDEERQSYYDMNLRYYQELGKAAVYQMEMDKLDTQIKMYSRCRDNIIAESLNHASMIEGYNAVIVDNGGTPITVYPEVSQTLAGIDNLIAECEHNKDGVRANLNSSNELISAYQNDIDSVHSRLSVTQYFTEDEYSELCHYIYEGSYSDEHVVITDIMTYEEKFEQMKTLYDRADARIRRVSQPTQEFSIDVENFVFIKEFEKWSEQLETGCLINVELDANDIAALFLCSITINYGDHNLSMTFGNRFNKFDTKSLFNDMLGQISKSANTLGYIKEVLYPIKSGEFDAVKEAMQTSRNLSMGQALASTNEEVVIDGSGYTGRKLLSNGAYDARQVKLTGRNLVFTDDSWKTCKVAIGEIQLSDNESTYGISAETIVGDMVIGKNIRILDSNNKGVFEVVDDKITASVGDINGRLSTVEQTSGGLNIAVEKLEKDLENSKSSVKSVRTEMGYTFDDTGLTIYADSSDIHNLVNHKGIYVSRIVGNSSDDVLTADNTGVNALNLTARQYLIVGGNSRLEDYNDGAGKQRTACFYIGG